MKLDNVKNKPELIATALLAVSVVSAVLIVFKVRGFFVTSARAENSVKQAIEQIKPDDKNVTTQLDGFRKVADALKRENLFSPPPPRQNPVSAVQGIIGEEALINGKLYKAGDKVADAEIVSVEPTAVTVKWDGQTKVFNPIDGASSGPGGPSRSGRPTSGSSGGGRPGVVMTEGPRPAPGGGRMPSPGEIRNMSEADRDRFRRDMRERFERMSEAERDRFRAEMRERMGGDRGGRGPGGGRGGGGPGGGRGERR